MNCLNCIYCVQSKREVFEVVCSNKTLLNNLGHEHNYKTIQEPCHCIFYKTKNQEIKEKIKKIKEGK